MNPLDPVRAFCREAILHAYAILARRRLRRYRPILAVHRLWSR